MPAVRDQVIELLNTCGPSTGLFHEYEYKLAKKISDLVPSVEMLPPRPGTRLWQNRCNPYGKSSISSCEPKFTSYNKRITLQRECQSIGVILQEEMGIFHKFPLYLGVCCVIIRTKPLFSSQKAANSKEGLFMKRIGMLTSGGDCQALNAAMRGGLGQGDDVQPLRAQQVGRLMGAVAP